MINTTKLAARIASAIVHTEPFPHICESGFLSILDYGMLRAWFDAIPEREFHTLRELGRAGPKYSDRRRVVELPTAGTAPLAEAIAKKFHVPIPVAWKLDFLAVRDAPGFELGPHTDTQKKLFTVLIYLAPDARRPDLGTAFYKPKDPALKCDGTVHHEREAFERVKIAPYAPNTLIAFARTDRSFHGVEPADVERRLLIFDVKAF